MKTKPAFYAPLFVLVIYILLIGSNYISGTIAENQDNVYLSLVVLQLLVFMIPGIFFCKLRGSGYVSKLNLRLFSPSKIGFILLSTATLICVSALIRLAQYYIAGVTELMTVSYQSYVPMVSGNVTDAMYAVLAFAVLPAITEEFIFRGIVQSEYSENGCGVWCSIIMSALMFSMLHLSPSQTPVYIVGGICFSLIVYTTRSLPAAMISHMLFNIYGLFVERYVFNVIKSPESIVFIIFVLAGLTLLTGAMALGEAERCFYTAGMDGRATPSYVESRKKNNQTSIKIFSQALLSPTFLVCIVVFIVMGFGIIKI